MSRIDFSKIKNNVIKNLLQTAQKSGIRVQQIDPNFSTFVLEYKGKRHYIFHKKYGLNKVNAALVSNKFLANKALAQTDIKVPKSFLCQNIADVKKLLRQKKLRYPFVIKPFDYSLGIGVTANIINFAMVKIAFSRIKKYWQGSLKKGKKRRKQFFIVEEHVNGNDYRLLVLNNKVIAVTQRVFPEITGNGKNTVRTLIKKYYQALKYYQKKNKNPLFDKELKRNLKMQKVSLKTILPRGCKIRLRQAANIFGGGIAINMTRKTNPYYKKIAVKAADEFDMNIAGVDLMTKDISKRGDYKIIEINSFPSLDMHENPDIGEPMPVAKLILKSIFPNLK